MKQFDPATGWKQNPSSVYHFNRQGNRLNVTRVEEGQEPPLPAPAETADMVREVFERLDEADASQALLTRVADNLKTLDDLAVKRGQLERVLADINREASHLQAQVQSDLDAARDNEDRNLKLRQYRRELLEQLARRLPATGKP